MNFNIPSNVQLINYRGTFYKNGYEALMVGDALRLTS